MTHILLELKSYPTSIPMGCLCASSWTPADEVLSAHAHQVWIVIEANKERKTQYS